MGGIETLVFLPPIRATGNQAGFIPSPRKQSQTETYTTTMSTGKGKTLYNGSPIHTEHYVCDCGWSSKFSSGDRDGAEKRMDLIVRLHRKKCPITNTGKFVETTQIWIPKKGKQTIIPLGARPI